MKSFFRDKSLFQQFAISFIITIFLPISVIGGISYLKGTYQIKNMVSELLEQLVANINSQFDTIMNDNNWLSLQIANKAEVRQFIEFMPDEYYNKYQFKQWSDKEILIDEMFSRFPIISRVSIVGDGGMMYSSLNNRLGDDNPFLYEKDKLVKRSENYKQILPQDGSMKVVMNRFEDENSNTVNYYLTFARRIFSTTPFVTKGTVLIDIRASSLDRVFGKMDLKNCLIWIIDNKGQIIYYPDSSKIGAMSGEIFNTEPMDQDKGSFTKMWNDENRFFVYHTSSSTGWKIVAEMPVQNLNMPVNDLGRVILFTFLVALPIALLVGYLFIRSILRPIRVLERGMKKIGDEEWKKIEGEIPKNEIGNLMDVYNKMTQKISDLIEKVYKTELEQREYQLARQKAEFQALQTQINPHFLYNTLSAINTYALMAEEADIQEMVEALSRMLRYAVQNPLEPVRIGDEVEHVRNFITIQSHRNKHMPTIEWRVSEHVDFPVIRLTLQPLVENVFQHAFSDGIRPEHKISISAGEEDGFLIVEVADNGCGIDGIDYDDFYTPESEKIKVGIGLKNVHRRIQIAYGPKYGLIIRKNKGRGITVRMLLPLNERMISL